MKVENWKSKVTVRATEDGRRGYAGGGGSGGMKRRRQRVQSLQGRKKEVVSTGDQQTPGPTKPWGQGENSHSDSKLPECREKGEGSGSDTFFIRSFGLLCGGWGLYM